MFTQNMRVRAPGRVAVLHAAGALWTLGACGSRVVAAVPARGRWRRAKSKRAKRRPGTRGRSGLASRGRGVRWCGWCNLHAVLRGVACAGEAPQARGNARSHVPRVFLAPAQRCAARARGPTCRHTRWRACVRASEHARTHAPAHAPLHKCACVRGAWLYSGTGGLRLYQAGSACVRVHPRVHVGLWIDASSGPQCRVRTCS